MQTRGVGMAGLISCTRARPGRRALGCRRRRQPPLRVFAVPPRPRDVDPAWLPHSGAGLMQAYPERRADLAAVVAEPGTGVGSLKPHRAPSREPLDDLARRAEPRSACLERLDQPDVEVTPEAFRRV